MSQLLQVAGEFQVLPLNGRTGPGEPIKGADQVGQLLGRCSGVDGFGDHGVCQGVLQMQTDSACILIFMVSNGHRNTFIL
jgi:hypothetical protein